MAPSPKRPVMDTPLPDTPPATAQAAAAPPRGPWYSLDDILQGAHELPRWIGWRLRALVALMLLGCAAVFLVSHWLTGQARLPFGLRPTSEGMVKIQSVDYPTLRKLEGQILLGLSPAPAGAIPAASAPGDGLVPVELLILHRSGRWVVDADQRQRHLELHRQTHGLLTGWDGRALNLKVHMAHAGEETVLVSPIGWSGLSPVYWLLMLLALLMWGVGVVVALAGLQWRNLAFLLLALCQSTQLVLMAVGGSVLIFQPEWLVRLDTSWRVACDLASAAALVQVAALHPYRLQGAVWYTALAWLSALGLWLGVGDLRDPLCWWSVQAGCIGLSVAAACLMTAALQAKPHPFTLIMRRFVLVAALTWLVLSLAIWLGVPRPDMQLSITTFGVMMWQVFAAMAVLLSPYLSRSRPILQEFSLLAASSTIAASLDLLFVAAFSLGQFASMTLSLFLSFGLYLIIRRWLMTRLPGRDSLTMERLFQRLYRIAREVERRPDALDASLMRLMRELFDPLEITLADAEVAAASLRGNGSVLLVPIPAWGGKGLHPAHLMVLKHSHKGQRLFTSEDARLADRVMEQLYRALSFDQAVEQGRSEERLRIAQDLHDDIGARLLTLMYQAPNAEIEEYIRHTIQDLKTLTRGLAAQSHGLAEAAGEWKRDLSQRLGVARCELDWQMSLDDEVALTMVQWSALTRILRELVSNAISHAKANKVQVRLALVDDRLTLSVEDNGVGREPAKWSHGLGLGGVRKRVKQLGGSVRWLEVAPCGIRCEVVVESFSGSANPTGTQGATNPGADPQLSH